MHSASPPNQSRERPVPLIPLPERAAKAEVRLPVPLTPLVGREREIAAVVELLLPSEVRLVTLTGPGGVGKTRIALAAAEAVAATFADGVTFVPLAAIRDPALVTQTIAQALGVRETADQPPAERLRALLRTKHLLLVLDNFEQVLPAAPLVTSLLTECPTLTLMVTSRATLRVYGERDVVVPPLALPDRAPDSLGRPAVERIGDAEAVRLFVARATAAQHDFTLTPANAVAVGTICERLDGLPLAIELAAARSKLLPPASLLERLDHRLSLLTEGAVGQPARLQSLREAIAWSHDLLSPEEQALFRRLAVFAGGFTLEAAEAVGYGEEESPHASTPLALVAVLLDRSLLRRSDDGEEPRFGMLETIREFALEQLAAAGEEAALRRRHAAFYLALAERSEPALYGPDQAAGFAALTRDHANLRAALTWLLETGDAATGLRLAVALGRFWHVGGYLGERQRWLTDSLAWCGDAPAALRAKALRLLGDGALDTGDLAAARTFYQRSLNLAREADDAPDVGEALMGLGGVAQEQGDLAAAEAYFADSLALREGAGDRWGAAVARFNLANVLAERGDSPAARSLIEGGLAICREIGYPQGIGRALHELGKMDERQGDFAAAARRYEESLARWRPVGYRSGTAEATGSLGWLALGRGDHGAAAAHFAESLALWREMESTPGIAASLEGHAAVAAARGQPEVVFRLAGAAATLREAASGMPLALERARLEPWLRRARRALGAAAAKVAWASGVALDVATATAVATEVATDQGRAAPIAPAVPRTAKDFGLTPRERDVLHLLVEGRSDREIAEALAIRPRTVGVHVSAILAKLGVSSRTAASSVAVRHGLA